MYSSVGFKTSLFLSQFSILSIRVRKNRYLTVKHECFMDNTIPLNCKIISTYLIKY